MQIARRAECLEVNENERKEKKKERRERKKKDGSICIYE